MNPDAILAFAAALFAIATALTAIIRGPRSIPSWTFAAGMMVLALESAFAGLTANSPMFSRQIRWYQAKLLVIALLPGVWLLFSLTYSRGNAREFLARWKFPLALLFAAPVVIVALFHDQIVFFSRPTGVDETTELRFEFPGLALHGLLLIASVLVLMNLERTFRASIGTMRWRLKFMILGIGFLFAVRAYTSSQVLLFHTELLLLAVVNSIGLLIASVLMLRSFLRPGQFDTHVYPSQTILKNSFTVVLAGAYLLIVGLLAKIVAFLGGDAAFPAKAFVVLVALVAAAVVFLSDRVRLYTKRFVSRNFQRPLFDYRNVWRRFTVETVSKVEQASLCRAVVLLVSDLFQVLSVTIWLVDDEKERLSFGASTAIPDSVSNTIKPSEADSIAVIRALRNRSEPVDVDSSTESWTSALRRCTPDDFHKGSHRICVPMIARGRLLGFMMLGDRVGGVSLSVQELDLLRCISDQTSANLLNIQLSHQLVQAKEMEAFQTMSAFFVHDLKNTASTLSLMLQNLPVHFQDPAFREDALRGISRTVNHINDIIRRLTLLRQELSMKPVESDLNALVTDTLRELGARPDDRLLTDLKPLPPLLIDREQIQKVVTNLVLNAREAVGKNGEVRIETRSENSWAVLAVTDNGCGMSPEFMDRSLFRPFQTTKKTGIGIGMFQSKMIVEAHHGKIEVESGLGKGTTFRVFLPGATQTNES